MSVANIWMLSAVVLPGGTMTQIVEQDFRPGLQEIIARGSGTVDPEFIAINQARPMFTFSTSAIATALGLADLNALAFASAVTCYFARVKQGGIRDGASSHIKMTIGLGMLIPMSLRASQDGEPAKLTYGLYARSSDGLTAPVTIATGQSLPTITAVSELFTIGPVSITPAGGAATALAAVQSIEWSFNPDVQTVAGEGQPYATFLGATTRTPTCAVQGLDMTALSTFGLNGVGMDAFTTYLRKIQKGGTRVAEATTQHIKLSGTAGMLLPRGARGPNNRQLQGEWNIVPSFDGTNDCVALSTSSAIT